MTNKVFFATVATSFLFVAVAGLLVGICIIEQNRMFDAPSDGDDAVRKLLFQQFPLGLGIINAGLMFLSFFLLLLGFVLPTRLILTAAAYAIVLCAIFSLYIGLDLWILTLRLKASFFSIWKVQPSAVQDLMEQMFSCCGYYNSISPAFVTNSICPSPSAAALQRGCAASVASFAGNYVNIYFTSVFGIVGIDHLLIVAIACLLKDRKDRERYRHIDRKSGFGTL